MDKKNKSNIRVRRAIIDALYGIMQDTPLDQITVTEIVEKAGVSRASYYRNFNSKEEVLISMVHDVLDEFKHTADYDLSHIHTMKHIIRSLSFFDRYRYYFINLYRSGYGMVLLDELNSFHESIAGDMPSHSADRYEIYIYMGALFNTVLVWMTEENPAPVETVAEKLYQSIHVGKTKQTNESL